MDETGRCADPDRQLNPGGHPNDEWILKILKRLESADVLVANYCDLPKANRDADPTKDENSRDDFDPTRDDRSLELATEAYALRVQPLVSQRTKILTGDLQLLEPVKFIEKLDTLIDEQLKALFVGSETKKTWDLPFEVRMLDPATPVAILGITEASGICPVTALLAPDAKPVPDGFNVLPKAECDKAVPVSVSVAYHPPQPSQMFDRIKSNVRAPSGDRSFRYVLPAQVRAVVKGGTSEYGTGVFSVAQLGHVVSLPAKRNSKLLSYDLAMIEATGGLKTFKLGTTGGLDAGTIDALAGAGGTILDARIARRTAKEADRKAEEAAADELTILTRESTLIKLKDEICVIQQKYGLACTFKP